MESFLCKKCKQLLSPMTKLNFFEHIKTCDGIDHSQPLGVTSGHHQLTIGISLRRRLRLV